MRITNENPDHIVLAEIGRRLARTRLERNISQQALAHEAGVSKRTVERVEAGEEIKLSSLIRILRVLGLLEGMQRLVPEPLPSPIERVKLAGKRRRRASHGPPPRRSDLDAESSPWRWGDEQGGGAGGAMP